MLDEIEELDLVLSHYVIAWASKDESGYHPKKAMPERGFHLTKSVVHHYGWPDLTVVVKRHRS